MCPKELMLRKLIYVSVLFVFTGIFHSEVCNGCHDLMQKAVNFNGVVIVTVRGNNYRIYFLSMIKDEAINLLRNADLTEKSGT